MKRATRSILLTVGLGTVVAVLATLGVGSGFSRAIEVVSRLRLKSRRLSFLGCKRVFPMSSRSSA